MLNAVLLIFLMGCRDNKIAEEDTQGWWESDSETKTDESSEEKEESFEEGDKDLEDMEACPEDFDPQASCEGTWETTMCYYDEVIWWCQDGVWLNEDDK